MDATAWVAVAGLVTTLLAAVLTEKLRQDATRRDRLFAERLEVYADLLQAAGRVSDNAQTWSSVPLADLRETPDDFLDRMLARLSVVASEEVYDLFGTWKTDVNAFNRLLWDARMAHRAAEHTDSPETPRTILSRLRAGEKADAVTAGFVELRRLIRREMGR